MADIILAPLNHAFIHIWTDEAIERELSDEFSFVVPGAQYMSIYRKRNWDGKIRLFNRVTKTIYAGLTAKIERWAQKRGYSLDNRTPITTSTWSGLDTAALIKQHPVPFEIRSYQEEAVTYGLHRQRCVLISPTASGKSLILYYLVRARMSHGPLLLIVPTISLVSQMVEDWRGYGWSNVEQSVHSIRGGVEKNTDKPVVVSTWQSIFRQPEAWFDRYTTVLGDECVGPNTNITLSNGNTVPISKIQIGDLVKTVNESTKEIEDKPVLRIHRNLSKHERKYRVTLESGKQLIITGNHKVLLTSGEWKRVDNLRPGEIINSL